MRGSGLNIFDYSQRGIEDVWSDLSRSISNTASGVNCLMM
jgi:hypothetical protein